MPASRLSDGLYAQWLHSHRRRLDLTQTELAEMTGHAQATISRWETGARLPDWHEVGPVARALGDDPRDVALLVMADAEAGVGSYPTGTVRDSVGHSGWSVRPLADLGERRALRRLVALCDSPLVTGDRRVGACAYYGG